MKYNLSNAHNVVYIAGPITKPCPMDNAYRACQFFRQLLGLGVSDDPHDAPVVRHPGDDRPAPRR